MEIRKAAYELCKALAAMPARKQIADLVLGLNNSTLNYFAEQQHAHILGYLMVSQEAPSFAGRPLPQHISPLKDEELKALAGFQKKLFELNSECVKRLTNRLPNCSASALSPYNQFEFKMPSDVDNIDLFPARQVADLVDAFNAHPQIDIAIASSSARPATFSQEYYRQYIWELEGQITTVGTLTVPDTLKNIDHKEHRDSQRRTFLRHIAAVTCVRASLSILNQLIYQKLFNDKLLVVDEDTIIKSGSYYFATGGLSLVFQNARLFLLADTDDLILSKNFALTTHDEIELWRIEKLEPQMGLMHIGEPRYAELRVIDKHLNPYGALFRSL